MTRKQNNDKMVYNTQFLDSISRQSLKAGGFMSGNIRILIVEGSLEKAASLQGIFGRQGHHVSVAHNNKEAIASIKANKTSIIINDAAISGAGLNELCQSMEADEDLRDIPLILLTNIAHHEDLIDLMGNLELLHSEYELTAQKNQELEQISKQLKEANEYIGILESNYRRLIEMVADAVVVLDQDKVIQFVNAAAVNLFGLSPDELLDKILDFPISPKEVTEVSVVRKDGTEPLAEMRVSEINWEGKKAYLASLRDITERKRVEKALQEGVKREAQAYAQGRLEVVDTILHNIGNAINSVAIGIGTLQERLTTNRLTQHLTALAEAIKEHQDDFSDYIQNDPKGQKVAPFIVALADNFAKNDKELARTLNRVYERAEHIADIIRTQKTLSSGSVYQKDINLKEAIDKAVIVLQDSINTMRIEVIVDCNKAPKEIRIQESEFHQMIVNLIKNSIEAIEELISSKGIDGIPFIKITCYTSDRLLIVEVKDSGIGIEGDKLEVIFRSGYTTKKFGSGLGLHSTANFVKSCGGQIVAMSDGAGRGAMMRIELPLSLPDLRA